MKRLALLLGVLLPGAALGAQTANLPAPPAGGFHAAFVETHTLPGFDTPLISRGELSFDTAHGFRWEISSPYHYVFEMRGGKAQEQLPDGRVRRFDPDQTPWLAAVERIFVGALAGDRAELQRYFEVQITPLTAGRRVLLTPKPGPIANAIANIEVTETAPGRPERLIIRETSGGRLDIRFTPAAP